MEQHYKIHIVYASADNTNLEGQNRGWVDQFVKHMQLLLKNLSISATVLQWELEESSGEIASSIKIDEPVLIVLSPHLIEHSFTYLPDEAPTFKIIKHPVNLLSLPPQLRGVLGYRFYETNSIGDILPLNNGVYESSQTYWLSLTDIGHDLQRLFNELPEELVSSKAATALPNVFLAETGADLFKERNMIKRELQRRGFRVLPERELPLVAEALEKQVRYDLEQSVVSIHLVGEDYGVQLKESERSIIEAQNSVASAYAKEVKGTKQFQRLVWVSDQLRIVDNRQQYFIDRLMRNAEEQFGAEILRNRIEDFKTMVQQVLSRLLQQKELDEGLQLDELENPSAISIYIISDQRDAQKSAQLAQWLKQEGYRVLLTTNNAEPQTARQVRRVHQHYLTRCDASIIFFGDAKLSWLETKLQDILKAPGLGRTDPLVNKAIFTDSEENVKRLKDFTFEKKQHQDAVIIMNQGAFSPEKINEFLRKIPLNSPN